MCFSVNDSSRTPSGPSLHHYRTPDIASARRGEEPLSHKSDIFQAGLVLAELFTGVNPCLPANVGDEEVILDKLPRQHGKFGSRIASAIQKMLTFDPAERPEAKYFIDVWQGILCDVVEHIYAIESRIL